MDTSSAAFSHAAMTRSARGEEMSMTMIPLDTLCSAWRAVFS